MKTPFKLIVFVILLCTNSSIGQTTIYNSVKEYNSIDEALKNPEKVIRLNLSNQDFKISDEDWSKFINLEYLNLKNDHLKEIPVGITRLKTLKIIDLSGNDFKLLPNEFENLINLEEVFLNDETKIKLPKTLSLLSKLPKLKTLHLENDGIKVIPKEILSLKNLENLYLNHNQIKEIPKIKSLDHLKYLDLNDNKIKPELQDMKNLNFGFKIKF